MTADIVSAARQTSYSAFLSYVHEDSETAGWLHGLLSRYWVPGRRRRRIYHDREQITATSLTEQIERALRQASFLIVCWSENAARSTWVPREIAFFLKAHPQAVAEDRVLICRTGPAPAAGDDPIPELPAGLRALAARTVFFPDLRGAPAQARGRARRPYLEAALSLLAPLVGLGDREEVLRLRLRRQIQVLAVVMAALLAAAASWWAWQRWLKTPEGLLHQNVARALAGARTEDIADTRLFATARAIGRLNRNDLLEPLSTMLPPDQLRDLFLASGYVSFPHPDCRAAARALGKLDSSSAHAWPEPLILVARICGGNWVERALPEPREPRQVADQARLLARYGYTLRALELARRADFPAPDRLSLRVAFALGRGPALAVLAPASEVSRWLANETNRYDQLSAALGLLVQLERGSLERSPLHRQILTVAAAAANGLDNGLFNNWDLKQRLAAHLALAGEVAPATHLLAATAPGQWTSYNERLLDEAAAGWAWRGLAYHRIHAPSLAAACFDAAEKSAAKPIPASRNWSEWDDLLDIFAGAGDWTRTFRAVEGPREERARQLLRCRALELWADHKVGGTLPVYGIF